MINEEVREVLKEITVPNIDSSVQESPISDSIEEVNEEIMINNTHEN